MYDHDEHNEGSLFTKSGSVELVSRPPVIHPYEFSYDESDLIGKGTFGAVYKGECRGDIVAVKILKTDQMKIKDLKDFKNECEILMALRHRNVVTFMGACVKMDNLAMLTEMLECDLGDFIKKSHHKTSFLTKLKILRDVSRGMAWLHGSTPSIIHRDLKPSNVLLDVNYVAKIADFGLSIITEKKITKKAGSMLWMAPECHRQEHYDKSVDMYSFGIVSWQVITGQKPFNHYVQVGDVTGFKKAITVQHERPPLDEVPEYLHELLEGLWDPVPQNRISFKLAGNLIDESILYSNLSVDEESRIFWRNNFGHKLHVKWSSFYYRLLDFLAVVDIPDKKIKKCIKYLFIKDDHKKIVTMEMFGKILQWFGPLHLNGEDILERIEPLFESNWFWGDISREQSEKSLKSKHFLIRFSKKGDIASTPFVLSSGFKSKKEGTKKYMHFLIDFKDDKYQLNLKYGKKVDGEWTPLLIQSPTLQGIIEQLVLYKPYCNYKPAIGSDFFNILNNNTGGDSGYQNDVRSEDESTDSLLSSENTEDS
eukprot:TRINITY_DN13441_c0_g1_i1.p1 TRINITY_DN13441_c0_g1~~TRINITY_DN13441_c0_g1_i1.p1  ORF type:complete len:578 (+),score=113.65 TRINITY_DN13441_c0_g1_i1:126-1736(+)